MTVSPAQLIGSTNKQKKFVLAIDRNTEGLTAVSTGVCGGCDQCRKEWGKADLTQDEFEDLVAEGKIYCEGEFSWRGCDLCGSQLGGNFEPWHALDANNELIHGARACVDCVCYLADGDLPGQDN